MTVLMILIGTRFPLFGRDTEISDSYCENYPFPLLYERFDGSLLIRHVAGP